MRREKAVEQEFIDRIHVHQGILHKICGVYANTSADRQDLKQEIVLQLWKSYPSFKGDSKFSTWMYRIALNTAITFTRKASWFKAKTVSLSSKDRYEGPQDNSEDIRTLYRAIAQLNEIEKAIILMWLDENSYRTIADAVGISEKNVSVKIVRIKKKLSTIIQQFQ